ncbi:MAG: L-lysine 6-transaminase [Planctomycetota bacterium]
MVELAPKNVRNSLAKHILADGLDLVFDLEESRGTRLVDAQTGKRYLDFFMFFASSPLGHNHPRMRDPKLLKRMGEVAIHNPSNSDVYTTVMADFVETFASVALPDTHPHLFFVAGGSLAVENALKTAFDWKVRKNLAAERGEIGSQVLHFKEAFHGRSGYTLSLTNTSDPRKTKYFPKFDWPRVLNPKLEFPLDEPRLRKVIEAEKESVAQIEQAFADRDGDIAAIILEPIQCEGGDNHFRPEFFQELRRLADQHEALLVFDEVQTGLGGTGKTWCYEHYDCEPDIVAFGKKTQVCGIFANRRIDEVPNNVFQESSRINSTWGGNLVDMARSQAFLEVIREESLIENSAKQGQRLLEKLQALANRHSGWMSNVRGQGLLVAFDLPSGEHRDRLLGRLFEEGMLALACGDQSVRFRPPLDVEAEAIEEAGQILDRVLERF